MSASQLAEEIASLPANLQEEVWDFVAFLKTKAQKQSPLQKQQSAVTPESITSIWISPGITMGETLENHYLVGNIDVVVHLVDGSEYVATFFTYESINRIAKSHQQTGEDLSGKYFWASDMIFIDKIDRSSIEEVIYDLVNEGAFTSAFKRWPSL